MDDFDKLSNSERGSIFDKLTKQLLLHSRVLLSKAEAKAFKKRYDERCAKAQKYLWGYEYLYRIALDELHTTVLNVD